VSYGVCCKYRYSLHIRACPGRYLAQQTLFISIVSVLSVFDIEPVDGLRAKYEFVGGFIRYYLFLYYANVSDET